MNNSRLEFANYVSNKILNYQFKEDEIKEYTLILMLLETGRRSSDLWKLKWEQIDFERTCIDNLVCKRDILSNIPLSQTLCSLLKQIKNDNKVVFQQKVFLNASDLIKRIIGYDRFSLIDLRGVVIQLLVAK